MNDVDRMRPAERLERLLQVDVFAGKQRYRDIVLDLLEQLGVLPRDHVFEPRHVVFLEGSAEADTGVHADMAEMIGGERNIHADNLSHLRRRSSPWHRHPWESIPFP